MWWSASRRSLYCNTYTYAALKTCCGIGINLSLSYCWLQSCGLLYCYSAYQCSFHAYLSVSCCKDVFGWFRVSWRKSRPHQNDMKKILWHGLCVVKLPSADDERNRKRTVGNQDVTELFVQRMGLGLLGYYAHLYLRGSLRRCSKYCCTVWSRCCGHALPL